jgi:hypothetical protein
MFPTLVANVKDEANGKLSINDTSTIPEEEYPPAIYPSEPLCNPAPARRSVLKSPTSVVVVGLVNENDDIVETPSAESDGAGSVVYPPIIYPV